MASNLWHSKLVEMGEVAVTVTSDVTPSKFPDAKTGKLKPPYVRLKIGAEEFTYTTENQQGEEFFRGVKGRSFVLRAEGSREDATLTYVREANAAAPAPAAAQPKRAPAPTKTAPPPQQKPVAPPPAQKPPPPAASAGAAQAPAADAAGSWAENVAVGEAAAIAAVSQPTKPQNGKPPPETPQQAVARAGRVAKKVANIQLIAFGAAMLVKEQIRAQFGYELTETMTHASWMNIVIELEKGSFAHQLSHELAIVKHPEAEADTDWGAA